MRIEHMFVIWSEKQMPGWDIARVQNDVNPTILRMRKQFSLDADDITF